MIGTEIRPESQTLGEDEEFRQFQAVFEKLAGSFGSFRVHLSQIGSYLWEERNPGLLGKFSSEEKAFKQIVKTVIGGAYYNAKLVIGERELALDRQGKQNRNARRYSAEEVRRLGSIFWFYLKDVSENPLGSGRWERVKTQCQKNFPELFGFLSRPTMAEEDLTEKLLLLPLEMTADDAGNLVLDFRKHVRGKEFNTVSGIHLTLCGIKMEFVNRSYLLYCKLQGIKPIEEERLGINNSAFLKILDFLERYLRENNLTFGEAIKNVE